MINYIIVDTANMFFRAKHVVRGDSLDTKIGMCWHIMFSSINKAWKQFHGNHVVFCLEGRSWRRSVYDPYKRNRDAVREALTPKELEEDKLFWDAYQEFLEYLDTKTNCTVLQDNQAYSSVDFDITFGTESTANTSTNVVLVRILLNSGDSVTALSIS